MINSCLTGLRIMLALILSSSFLQAYAEEPGTLAAEASDAGIEQALNQANSLVNTQTSSLTKVEAKSDTSTLNGAQLATTITEVAPFGKLFDEYQSKVNQHYNPIDLKTGSNIRGLSLSGQSVVCSIDGPGQTYIDSNLVSWQHRYHMTSGCVLLNWMRSA